MLVEEAFSALPLRSRRAQRSIQSWYLARPGPGRVAEQVRLSLDSFRRRLHRRVAVGMDKSHQQRRQPGRGVFVSDTSGPSGSRAQACLQPAHFCKLLDPTKGIDVTRHLDADRGLPAESLSKLDGIRSGNHDFSDVTAFVDGH